jgi:hypothetical protein
MRADSNPSSNALRPIAHAFCAALLLAVAGNALSLPGKRFVGQYDFGYAIRGDRPARPAQVFDDGGGKVYFEARPGQPMPAVFAGKELALLVMQSEGQYFTARTAASEFTLVLGGARAIVRRGDAALGEETIMPRDEGGGRLLASADGGLTAGVDYRAAPPSRFEHEQPVVFAPGRATLRPEVLDALSALVVRIGRDTTVQAVGRNDAGGADGLATLRAEALRNALLARGVPARAIQMVETDGVPGASRPKASVLRWTSGAPARESSATPLFEIASTDGDIAVSLRRWARASGYDLEWDVGWVAPIEGAMRLDAPSFPDAVRQVVAGLHARGYPVQARVAADHVIRFTAAE